MKMPTPTWVRKAMVLEVHDGDTIRVLAEQAYGSRQEIWLRLKGVDTPELSEPSGGGVAAKDFVIAILQAMPSVTIETFRTRGGADLRTFIRYVADVWLPDGRLLQDVIREAGHVKARTPETP